jgi:hypothetical protein
MWLFSSVQFTIEFDAAKSERNERERGLSFEKAAGFDFTSARIWMDTRRDYPEPRYLALGYLDGRLHSLCFSLRGSVVRVISFRRANQREGDRHGFALTLD